MLNSNNNTTTMTDAQLCEKYTDLERAFSRPGADQLGLLAEMKAVHEQIDAVRAR